MKHKVKVVQEGYFWIDDEDLPAYDTETVEVETVDQALEHQKKWHEDGSAPIDEIVDVWTNTTMTLTGETE